MSSCGNPYPFGSLIRISVTFTSAITGALVDPTNVILKVQYAGYSAETFTYALAQVERASVGQFYYDYLPANDGFYKYSWEGTGAVTAASYDSSFNVTKNLFG